MFANGGFLSRSGHRSRPPLLCRFLGILAVSAACLAGFGVQAMAWSRTLVGSNFIWYHLNFAECAAGHPEAARDPFAAVTAYTTPDGRLEVDKALAQMRRHGQSVIALGLFHEHGGSRKNTILDSSGGAPSPDIAQALSALIDTIVGLDFQVLYLRFFPFGKNSLPISNDKSLSVEPDLYRENLSFIESVLRLTSGKKIEVITDLCNECSPSSAAFDDPKDRRQARLMVYTRRLWGDYVGRFGPDHTVGFSIIPDKFRIANLPAVYDAAGVRPRMLDIHIYPSNAELDLLQCRLDTHGSGCEATKTCPTMPASEACHPIYTGSLLDDVARQLATIGFNMPWIIGETFYDDPKSAMYLRTGINLTHHEIRFIVQWPLRRVNDDDRRDCDDPRKGGGVNVGTPFEIDAYSNIN
jgi:hypothetical protein